MGNEADRVIKQNDLDVFDFLIKSTKKICDEQATALLQGKAHEAKVQLCYTSDNSATLKFADTSLQKKFDRILAKGSHQLLTHALVSVSGVKVNLMQQPAGQQQVAVADGQSELMPPKYGPIPDCGLLS